MAAAEVTSSSAVLWTRAPRAGRLELRIGTRRISVQVGAPDDLTANVIVRGLKPATRYTYRLAQGAARSRVGSFRTAAAPSADAPVSFAAFGEVRLQTLEAGGPVGSGVDELITGPVATMTFAKEIDKVVGKSNGAVVTALFFKPQPPRGVGFPCANTDTFSYVQVHVTSASLTLTPKDSQGKLLQDAGLGPCGPFTIPAK